MPRVLVTAEEEAFIRERIDRFSVEGPENLQWQLPYMRIHSALPLYVGWTETAGIQPNGTLIRTAIRRFGGWFRHDPTVRLHVQRAMDWAVSRTCPSSSVSAVAWAGSPANPRLAAVADGRACRSLFLPLAPAAEPLYRYAGVHK